MAVDWEKNKKTNKELAVPTPLFVEKGISNAGKDTGS